MLGRVRLCPYLDAEKVEALSLPLPGREWVKRDKKDATVLFTVRISFLWSHPSTATLFVLPSILSVVFLFIVVSKLPRQCSPLLSHFLLSSRFFGASLFVWCPSLFAASLGD
jgi:hypothetical protein